jgi:hypothetical protein
VTYFKYTYNPFEMSRIWRQVPHGYPSCAGARVRQEGNHYINNYCLVFASPMWCMVNCCAKRRVYSCAGARVRQVPHGYLSCAGARVRQEGNHYINNYCLVFASPMWCMVNRCAKRRVYSCAGARVRQVPHGYPSCAGARVRQEGNHYINNYCLVFASPMWCMVNRCAK